MERECDKCNDVTITTGAVLNGSFGNYCNNCINGETRKTAPGFAQYSRDRDREDNFADLLQPWHGDGTPNKKFIAHYPERAKDLFTEEEIKTYG